MGAADGAAHAGGSRLVRRLRPEEQERIQHDFWATGRLILEQWLDARVHQLNIHIHQKTVVVSVKEHGEVTKTDIVTRLVAASATYCRANELLRGGIWRQSETGRWTDEFLLGAVSGDRIVPSITAAMPIKAQTPASPTGMTQPKMAPSAPPMISSGARTPPDVPEPKAMDQMIAFTRTSRSVADVVMLPSSSSAILS